MKPEITNIHIASQRISKIYDIKIDNDKEITVNKWWQESDIDTGYDEVDWEFYDKKSQTIYDALSDDDQQELSDFINGMTLTKIQKEYCLECGSKMHEVPDSEQTELYLWCNNCDVSMDSDGGYTK